jgi:phosphatidylserine/phosphatidylglycerophosphate/cardiolipin synthase-like enzyme
MIVQPALTVETPVSFVAALSRAHDVALTAYTLRDGAVRDALVAAARRGVPVCVRLERDPLDDAAGTLHRANADTVALLRAAGATAALTGPGEPTLHLKAAVVDGVAWLDDRNWAATGAERILRDTVADDVAAVRSAVDGGPGHDGHFATTKSGALRLEADVIEQETGAAPLVVESESFGGGPVYNALLHRAQAGLPTRLIVAGREVAESPQGREGKRLARLAALGVEVRVGDPQRGDLDEKLAVGGDDGWVGSANATDAHGSFGAQRDWGMATRTPAVVADLRAAFERNWRAARPLADVPRDGAARALARCVAAHQETLNRVKDQLAVPEIEAL